MVSVLPVSLCDGDELYACRCYLEVNFSGPSHTELSIISFFAACNYGDPQVRPRLIIFAAKNFVRMPDDPVCTHGPGKRPYTTTKEVLDYLCTPVAKHLYPNMGNHTTGDCKDATKMTEQKGFSLLNPNGLAPGILASGKPIFHYAEKGPDGNLRSINVREAAALQSFPLDYEFLGTQTQKYKQVGNAVPCGLAGAIARSVRDSLRYMYLEELEEEGDDDVEAGEEEKKENSDN